MPTKFGTSRFGTSPFSEVLNQSGIIKQPESYLPKKPSFFHPKVAQDIRRRHYLALTQWGTPHVLYQRKLSGDSLTQKINSFDTTTPSYTKTIWSRGVGRDPNFSHPNSRKIRVKVNNFYMTQVGNEKDLFGTFSFYVKIDNDKNVILIFSKDFDPTNKSVVAEYDTLCGCTDPISLQPSNTRCPICFGTSFEGGYDRYWSPEDKYGYIYIRQRFSPKMKALKEQGWQISNQAEFWSLPEPLMKDKDIVEQVEGTREGQRFWINSWNLHSVGIHDTSQVFQMTELTPTDPAYNADFL